jgi:hypothetical protein
MKEFYSEPSIGVLVFFLVNTGEHSRPEYPSGSQRRGPFIIGHQPHTI